MHWPYKLYSDYFSTKLILFIFILSFSDNVLAQEEELWFGTYTNDAGEVLQGRYKIVRKGRAIKRLILEPYGKAPMKFNIIKNDTIQRFVKLSWPNEPDNIGTLIQYSDGYYAGNFEDRTKVLPMVIKQFNFQDAQLQGNWFEPSEIEINIIEHAVKLLSSVDAWNKDDDRVCHSNEPYSLFCALYESSIRVDGEYRHLRPAVKFVREAIKEKYPQKYEHVLVDFNNAEEITLKEVHDILGIAKRNLLEAMN
ncbi:hypothetical protein FNH22_05955 [Fulvivirga sp. M361]|uniref:hypothetical protein n=1 Tax=Fulvivirga sp. M361 TaxID=2594266 RepID=UPI00117B8DD3|nr:hypothetical protein [Fulvivirga sp. M361]TRX60593.1 hypothetical protein FNH22_05955 [Fulvivirga sp. M361]